MRRRRLIAIAAATAGAALVPGGHGEGASPRVRWQGTALGAEASLVLVGVAPRRAQRLITDSLAELARLEAVFSLQRGDSALARLNRDGRLAAAPPELRLVLAEARRISARTDGAFDVTVQPLWRLYADHFARPGAPPEGPDATSIERARELVDWRAIEIDGSTIRMRRAGMAVTLNGIAQGYITDRIAALLLDAGMERALVDLGEIRAWGEPDPGRPWRIAIAAPDAPQQSLELATAAIATSAPVGTRFEPSGRFHHLIDPRTGQPAIGPRRVSVVAERAMLADALSTALAVAPPPDPRPWLARGGAMRALVEGSDGRRHDWVA